MKKLLLATLALLPLCEVHSVFATPVTAAAPVTAVTAPLGGVEVKGDVLHPGKWTLAQLQKLTAVQTVKTTLKGSPYIFRGVPLAALVQAATPRLDLKAKHSEARFVVLARGADGYTVALSWPELMPQVGSANAYVAWEANGKPLPGKEGPFRLVVVGDQKPMRWVYHLASLEVIDSKRIAK